MLPLPLLRVIIFGMRGRGEYMESDAGDETGHQRWKLLVVARSSSSAGFRRLENHPYGTVWGDQ